MAVRDRVYKYTDRPMTWTRAVLLGLLIWVALILLTGQVPSYIIYWADANINQLIDWSRSLPGVSAEGLNTKQIQIIRDIVATGVQMGFLVLFLAGAYFWQRSKQKRTGARGPEDTVKGYLPGK